MFLPKYCHPPELSGYSKTELIYKEYLTATLKLQPNVYSQKLREHFDEICFILS